MLINQDVGNAILDFVRKTGKDEAMLECFRYLELFMDDKDENNIHKIKKDKSREWYIEVTNKVTHMRIGIYSF